MRLALTALTVLALSFVATGCGDDQAATTGAADAPAAASFETVAPAAIAPRAAAGDVLLVDVREDDEWAAGHAPDAVHVPLATVADRLGDLTERAAGRPIAFICRSGNRSAQAAATAADGGVAGVINVSGGMGAWAQAGLPLAPADGRVL